jgi:predicted nucleic acid-binding protein
LENYSGREAQRKMKYCADTWFLLELYKNSEEAVRIFRSVLEAKNKIVIPTVSIMELLKVSIMKGEKLSKIESLVKELKATQKVQVVVLDEELAKGAAKISVNFSIPFCRFDNRCNT